MHTVATFLQVLIAIGILNVWLVRPNRVTAYRGGAAQTLEEEFRVYGLSKPFMFVIGALKLSMASLLLIGVLYPMVTPFASLTLGVLMAGAVMMHLKVRDPFAKMTPAFAMLILCAVVTLLTLSQSA